MPRLTEGRFEETYSGASYSREEVEFIMAMERYQRETHRRFPTWHEVLRVLKNLGYRKVSDRKTNHRVTENAEKNQHREDE